jgi:hypothetical protein
MTEHNNHLTQSISLDQPAQYRIEIQGRLDQKWAASFDGMTMTNETFASGLTVTTLRGAVADQAALHGMLNHIRDLGLPLISVQYLETH